MPRITLSNGAQFTRVIKGRMAYQGLDQIHLAKELNICEKTMGKYIRQPITMPLEILIKMKCILHIADEDVLALIRC